MPRQILYLILGLAGIIAAVTFIHGSPSTEAAGPRLVSYEPLPPEDGPMCESEPVNSEKPLREAFKEDRLAAAPEEVSKRKPLRMIRDPYFAYSAVAVDPANNEVVLTDENLFHVLVYDRLSRTPSTSMTEPKRTIGGLKTKIEFQCGLYIDPSTGDIYAVNNDTVDTLVIFSRQARGDVVPTRELHTPHGTFGIAVDESTKELFLTVQHDSAVVVFPKEAQGEDPPIRLLQGDNTRLADPHGMALDPKNGLIYVANHGSVHQVRPPDQASGERPGRRQRERKPFWPLMRADAVPGSGRMVPPSINVYAKDASGDAPPLRVIEGPKTQLNWPTGVAVDPEHNELFVANDGGSSILVFKASASGDVAPIRVLKGSKSLVKNPTGVFLDSKNHELWVANFGNHTAAAYNPTASGDTPPVRVIRSAPADKAVPGMGNPHPIAYDSKREEILVPN